MAEAELEGAPAGSRRDRTRARLIESASGLIAEKGVAGLRIQQITERAGVALGSFYNHFATKEDLVEAVVAGTVQDWTQAIVADMAPFEDPAVVVAYAGRRVVLLASDEPELARLFVNLDQADSLFETIIHRHALAALEAGSASGRFVLVDPDAALIMLVGAAIAVMRAVLDGRCAPGVDVLFAEAMLRAIGVAPDEAAALAQTPVTWGLRHRP